MVQTAEKYAMSVETMSGSKSDKRLSMKAANETLYRRSWPPHKPTG